MAGRGRRGEGALETSRHAHQLPLLAGEARVQLRRGGERGEIAARSGEAAAWRRRAAARGARHVEHASAQGHDTCRGTLSRRCGSERAHAALAAAAWAAFLA